MITRILPLLLLFISHSLFAQDAGPSSLELVGERPNAGGEATEVTVTLYLIDIDRVDDVNQRFDIDMFLHVAWQDPRLAAGDGRDAGRSRAMPLNEIWSPRGLVVNDRGLEPQLPMVATVDDQGNVQYRQRLAGKLAVDMDLRDFPFDTQILPIEIISYQYSPEHVRFASPKALSLDNHAVSTDGWEYRMLEPEIGEFSISTTGSVRPQLTFGIEAKRYSRYYVVTMLLPIALILFMSWTAFWLQPDIIPTRIGISTASIFSLIAFGFSMRLSLPPVAYVTRADIFVMGSMLMVFLALAVAVIGSRWANSDRLPQASRLNSIARWGYVALFFVVATAALA